MDIKISSFQGLNQYGDDYNRDPRYAVLAKNVYTQGGILRPFAVCTDAFETEISANEHPFYYALPAKIETLMVLYRRWTVPLGGLSTEFYAFAGGELYVHGINPLGLIDDKAWYCISSVTAPESPTYGNNVFSCLNYELTPDATLRDVLIVSNATDGMFYVDISGDSAAYVNAVTTPKDFGVIARFNERIWGGAIATDPDMLVYSAPYDFTDWAADVDIPEDGGGDILLPTWDGDSFTAMAQFGNYLIAFKNHSIWRVSGTDPGVFVISQQYGGGTLYHRTVAVDSERIIMLGDTGLLKYDGLSVTPFFPEQTEEFIKTINWDYATEACACMWRDKYYLSVPTGASTTNNAVLIYNVRENTWMVRDDVAVELFLSTPENLYFTSTTIGKVYLWKEDSWEEDTAIGSTQWVTPWFDTGDKSSTKGPWTVYFTLEAKAPGAIDVSIETEKGKKTKTYTFPDNEGVPKQKSINFGGVGRRFRLHLESESPVPWRIIGGVEIAAEVDED